MRPPILIVGGPEAGRLTESLELAHPDLPVAHASPALVARSPEAQVVTVTAEDFRGDPRPALRRVCKELGIAYDQAMLSPFEAAVRAGSEVEPLSSAATPGFAPTLATAGASVLMSTYQTNKLVTARAAPDGSLNTHFRDADKPMGLAVAPGRLAVGTRTELWDLRDMAAAADPGEDACYLLRNRHVTGDVAVHDLAFAGGELWMVATAFSCLATLDAAHSFRPRWTPPQITRLAADDRCHLNGLAVIDDQPAYVTALGTGDDAKSWRAGRAAGGVLIDVASGETVAAELSMPHSPRWHEGRLWVLESGRGTLATVDLAHGSLTTVAELPGFTRGLAFLGPFALVGLSQVRETTTFGGLPLTERVPERRCGVWIVDTRSGAVADYLVFEDLVQELFDVAVLPHRFPEIAEAAGERVASAYALP